MVRRGASPAQRRNWQAIMRQQGFKRIIVQWVAGVACLVGSSLACADHPYRAHRAESMPHAPGIRVNGYGSPWGLRPSYSGLYAIQPGGGYRPVSDELRSMGRPPANGEGQPSRGGSIRDAVTRYNEERGGDKPFPPPQRRREEDSHTGLFPSLYHN
jgi:hypothetical protein